MLAPRFAYSVTQQEAIKCAKSPMTRTAASQVMKSFLAKGTFRFLSPFVFLRHPCTRTDVLCEYRLAHPPHFRPSCPLCPYPRRALNLPSRHLQRRRSGRGRPRRSHRCRLQLLPQHCDQRSFALPPCPSLPKTDEGFLLISQGYKCPNEDCGIRLHTFCIAQQIQDGRCPDRLELGKENPCEQSVSSLLLPLPPPVADLRFFRSRRIWPRNPNTRKYHGTPVGVLALSSQGGADDESDPESEMDVEETQGSRQQKRARKSGASGGKGKGKGRKSRAEDSEEDEDELMDEDEDEGAFAVSCPSLYRTALTTSTRFADSNAGTSPAAVRKSSGRAAAAKAKKRVVLASDEEDDDEE